jgi:hypothetical protein
MNVDQLIEILKMRKDRSQTVTAWDGDSESWTLVTGYSVVEDELRLANEHKMSAEKVIAKYGGSSK